MDYPLGQKQTATEGSSLRDALERVCPISLSLLSQDALERVMAVCSAAPQSREWPECLTGMAGSAGIPEFLPELARLELVMHRISSSDTVIPMHLEAPDVNPTLQIMTFSWKGLASLIACEKDAPPQQGEEMVLVWKDPKDGKVRARAASGEDLLVLKVFVEGIEPEEIARAGNVPVSAVEDIIDRSVEKGIVLRPQSLIRRTGQIFASADQAFGPYLSTSVFTLQWHVTQACDLHCKHCYDRSDRPHMKLEEGLKILDDFRDFCSQRHARGQISFSGGNPLLYSHFTELYRAAAERGFITAILGNPSTREEIEELISIQMPSFFQVSLEGLEEHNDNIRGRGHFERVTTFLDLLRKLDVYAMVMLTLTRDNVDQVVPLASFLRDRADTFNFNRLSMVGEGSNLRLPDKERYISFLEAYAKAAEDNPVMGFKDNLFNITRSEKGDEPFGGCTGCGCGAAFNFISILPDGEAHACRKFPSMIGNVLKQGIAGVYDSAVAERYRSGCSACDTCRIRPVCGGCLAVAYGHGLDIFEEKDPYCFMKAFGGGE